MRPHRRRGPLEHVLVAGDADELPAIQALLHLLPRTAYGQVFVESAAGTSMPPLAAPARVTVTQLGRDGDAEVGDLLTAAVNSWLAEWMPEEPDPDRACTLWAGSSARARVNPAGATLESL